MTLDLATILAGASPLTLLLGWLYWQEKQDHKATKKASSEALDASNLRYTELVNRLLAKVGATDA